MRLRRISLSPAWAFSLAAVIFLAGLGSYGLVEQSDYFLRRKIPPLRIGTE